MPEGPNPIARKGRRDPDLAERLMQDDELEVLNDAQEGAEQEVTLLDNGDLVMARFSQEHKFQADGTESWFALGVVTRVRDDEDASDTFLRAATFVHDGVEVMIDNAEDRRAEAAEARRSRPIQYRN